jgi:mRNA interferase HigB
MQVISRRALREFWSLRPQSRDPLLAWLRLIAPSEHPDFESLKRTFASARYVAPYTVFRVDGCNAWLIAIFHYSRRRVFIRHVLTRADYEMWLRRATEKLSIREPLNGAAYAVDSARVARVAVPVPGEAVLDYERTAWQDDDRLYE